MYIVKKPFAATLVVAIVGVFVATFVPATVHTTGSAPVTIVNPSPIPVTGTITGQITGQVGATQSGPWTVNLGQGVEKLDTANAHLTNIESSVGQLRFDPEGSLYTALRGPVQTTAPVVSKLFHVFLRLDPSHTEQIPVTVSGIPTTINMTMAALFGGHDNESVSVGGPFADALVGFMPIILDSQKEVVTFPTAIPVDSVAITCLNAVEHCDFGFSLVGY